MGREEIGMRWRNKQKQQRGEERGEKAHGKRREIERDRDGG